MAENTVMNENEKTGGQAQGEREEMISIQFSRGLMGEPYERNGIELVNVKVANADPEDKRPWQYFAISPRHVHVNRSNPSGNGLWAMIPKDGETTLMRSIPAGLYDGKKVWRTESEKITNEALKLRVESYKNREMDSRETVRDEEIPAAFQNAGNGEKSTERESVLERLSEKKEGAKEKDKPSPPKGKEKEH